MYFGDYLVEKSLISHDSLMHALCYQIESVPSLIRILFESKVISSDLIVEALKSQVKKDVDIINVLLSENKITQKQLDDLVKKQSSHKPPLGETLLRLNLMSAAEIEQHTNNYFSEMDAIAEKNNNKFELSNAALESLKELGMEIPGMSVDGQVLTMVSQERKEVVHFLNLFSEKQKNRLIKLIEIMEGELVKSNPIANYFNSLFRDFHIIKGAATFSDITILEPFLNKWDLTIDEVLLKGEEGLNAWSKTHLTNLKSVIENLWQLRLKMEKDNSDLGIMITDENIREIKLLTDKL